MPTILPGREDTDPTGPTDRGPGGILDGPSHAALSYYLGPHRLAGAGR
ncbi:hypothetical protein [Streptomyces sp. XY431]|nr:hypothetical protein [Streptomyces sp. XY431]